MRFGNFFKPLGDLATNFKPLVDLATSFVMSRWVSSFCDVVQWLSTIFDLDLTQIRLFYVGFYTVHSGCLNTAFLTMIQFQLTGVSSVQTAVGIWKLGRMQIRTTFLCRSYNSDLGLNTWFHDLLLGRLVSTSFWWTEYCILKQDVDPTFYVVLTTLQTCDVDSMSQQLCAVGSI